MSISRVDLSLQNGERQQNGDTHWVMIQFLSPRTFPQSALILTTAARSHVLEDRIPENKYFLAELRIFYQQLKHA
jgi:hypothetical protein